MSGKKKYIIEIPNPSKKWPDPIFCGWMKKYTITFGKVKWNNRFFVLTMDGQLFYFKSEKSTSCRKVPIKVKDEVWRNSHIKINCVQLCSEERKEKPFYVFTEEDSLVDKFRSSLKIAGGIEKETPIVEDVIPNIASKNVRDWTPGIVLDWLCTQYLDLDSTFVKYRNEFSKVSGKELLKLDETKIRDKLGIKDPDHCGVIYRSIEELIDSEGEMDYGAYIVQEKIRRVLAVKQGKIRLHEYIKEVSRELYLTKQIASHYLDTSPPPRMSSIDPILQVFEVEEGAGSIENMDFEKDGEIDLNESFEHHVDGTYLGLADPVSLPPVYPKDLTFSKISKAHLIISNRFDYSDFEKSYSVLSPLMTCFPNIKDPLDNLQIGVAFGPWYFMFNKTGLIIPKRINSVLLKVSALYDTITLKKEIDFKIAPKYLAELIEKWNISIVYDSKSSNSYHFVEDFFAHFDVNLAEESELVKSGFLDDLIKKGAMGLKMPCSKAFKKAVEFTEKTDFVQFRTHEQLDKFLSKISLVDLEIDYPTECKMLKIFDRCFWLSHYNDPKNKDFMPCLGEGSELKKGKYYEYWNDSSCPFEDCRISMNDMWFFENKKKN